MTLKTNGEMTCLERLRQEALDCLETFPNKIFELNDLVNEYTPESVRNNKYNIESVDRKVKCQSTLSTTKNFDMNSVSDFGDSSYYSLSMCDRSRSRHGVCKRRYCRSRGITGCNIRRRPGPLGQLLVFIVGSLSACTKRIVNNVISMLLYRRKLKNARCGTSSPTKWNSSLSTYVTTLKKDTTIIGILIDTIRPAVVQLITDTTILKRWLHAVALNASSPPIELTNATRSTETIDCWAYELFFHLKYLQVNRARRTTDNMIVEAKSKTDNMIHTNLWHRLVQLRDNYIILHQNYKKICDLDSEKQQE